MTNRHFVTASVGAANADKKLDEFLEGLSSLVANAVADGIKAGLEAKGVQVQGGGHTQVENHGVGPFSRFKAPAAAPAAGGGLAAFKLPKGEA